jgi:hypothetical protein
MTGGLARLVTEALPWLWMGCSLTALLLTLQFRRSLRPLRPVERHFPVVVIVPVRGDGPGFARFLAALAAQDWPDWRVVFAVDSPRDTARPRIEAFIAGDPARRSLVVAPRATRRAQKIENQLAALAHPRDPAAVVVLADADGVPPPAWLTDLLRPIANGRAEITTGYRWILPEAPLPWRSPWSWVLALGDLPLTLLPRMRRFTVAWGGAVAMTPAALARLDLPRGWDSVLSEDLAFTVLARRAGLAIHHTHRVLVPNPVEIGAASLGWLALRHYRSVRLLMPRLFLVAGLALLLPVLGLLATLAGAAAGPWAALVSFLALQARLTVAQSIARRTLPPAMQRLARHELALARLLLPLAHLARLGFWLASCAGRDLRWAGFHYRMHGPWRTEVLASPPET